MLIALWQFDREHVLAGLLLFRLTYYLIPFALSLLILGVRELILNLHFARAPPVPGTHPTSHGAPPIANKQEVA
jgi:hypothetical protein